ncbi:hypothetical protein ABPG77_010124 [Micractinium sp. CCAP 211/92]
MGAAEATVRFRHTLGDVGPFPFPLSSPIGDLKAKLLEAWPTEGALAAERPASEAEIKLICAGKFMDNNVVLGSLQHVLGEPGSDVIVTMHIVLRPPQPQKAAAPAKQQPESSKGCCCIQ